MFSIRRRLRRKRRKPEQSQFVTYETIGDEVSIEGCLVQAAQAIDLGGMLAARSGNSERMLQAGEYWTKLADFIVALGEHQDKKDVDKKKSDFPTGFQPQSSTDKAPEAEKEFDVRDDED